MSGGMSSGIGGGTSVNWDWDEQRADTEGTVAHLIAEQAVPEGAQITLDIQTVASPAAGPLAKAAYLSALEQAGYRVETYTNDEGQEIVEVTIADIAFAAGTIWEHERAVSEIALSCQWMPDGWGFWEPDA